MPDDDIIPAPPHGEPVNRWREAKRTGKVGLTMAGVGVQVAQGVTGVSALALVTAGAAASATGIGLIVTGAVLTLSSSVLSARSANKSRLHRNHLQEIYDRRNCYGCHPLGGKNASDLLLAHQTIADGVLPYIIQQKTTKYHRKVVGAVPGVGLLETVRAVGKKAYKYASGTLGVKRYRAARWLGYHLITCNCGLAQAIVAELYSFEEMLWIKDQKLSQVTKLLEDKIKST